MGVREEGAQGGAWGRFRATANPRDPATVDMWHYTRVRPKHHRRADLT